jgi:transcriptional regulator with XRE-family HTH domain
MICMADSNDRSVTAHFGRQLRKARRSRGWTLRDLEAQTGIPNGNLSRIENGYRSPTAAIAAALDKVFPERDGWFSDWHRESKSWNEVPAGFRNWAEFEDIARHLYVWAPGIVHGLLQTEGYARGLLATSPGITEERMTERLAVRMERQRRVLFRDDPPQAWLIVDELSLYRLAGSPQVMTEQMRHLLDVAAMPHVTLTVLPAVVHPATQSELIIADEAAYCEHMAGGYAYSDAAVVSSLTVRFDALRAECYRQSESITKIERMCESWTLGASPLTAGPTAGHA